MKYVNENVKNKLIEFAKKSNVNQKHSAALIKGDCIYEIGINKYCTNKKLSTVHAEMDVLFSFKSKYKKMSETVDIIIIRLNNSCNNINLKNSRPCNRCIEILQEYNIRRVYYSNEMGEIICENLKEMLKIHISSGYRYRNKIKYT